MHQMQQRVQQRWFERNSTHIRPNNLRFPYAVTPRSNNRNTFFHLSTNEQTPTQTAMETIWFAEMEPKDLNNPHSSTYNPLLSYRNWANMKYDSRSYNFVITPLHYLKDRVSEFCPPLPSENTNIVKRSTKNMGRDKIHQAMCPILKQFYSLTEPFLYDYDYEFRVPISYARLTILWPKRHKIYQPTAFLTTNYFNLVSIFYIQHPKTYRITTTE